MASSLFVVAEKKISIARKMQNKHILPLFFFPFTNRNQMFLIYKASPVDIDYDL